jgi:methyl-accepting chemotaxis protein
LDTKRKKIKSFRTKFLVLVSVGILIPMGVLIGGTYITTYKITDTVEKIIDQQVLTQVQVGLNHTVQSMASAMEAFYNEKVGTIPEEELLTTILKEFGKAKFSNSGYFFVYQYDGVCLVSPKDPSQEGQNLWNLTDNNGKKPVREFIETAQKGGGFVYYMWQNPKTKKLEDKVSYVKPVKFGYLELAVGAGSYLPMLDSIRAQINRNIENTKNIMLAIVLTISGIILILMLIFINSQFVKTVSEPIDNLILLIKKMADGDFSGGTVLRHQWFDGRELQLYLNRHSSNRRALDPH